MVFEFRCAWQALRPGGVMISDDIDESLAIERFVVEMAGSVPVIGCEASKAGSRFGILRKGST